MAAGHRSHAGTTDPGPRQRAHLSPTDATGLCTETAQTPDIGHQAPSDVLTFGTRVTHDIRVQTHIEHIPVCKTNVIGNNPTAQTRIGLIPTAQIQMPNVFTPITQRADTNSTGPRQNYPHGNTAMTQELHRQPYTPTKYIGPVPTAQTHIGLIQTTKIHIGNTPTNKSIQWSYTEGM